MDAAPVPVYRGRKPISRDLTGTALMDFFPIFLKLNDQTCLVVGGGDVGLRKARLLRAAGAHVTIVSPELSPAMACLAPRSCLA